MLIAYLGCSVNYLFIYFLVVEILNSHSVQATGEDYSVEPGESRRPFRALLDVGLIRTTTGNRVFGALKVIYLSLKTTSLMSCLHLPCIS